MITLNANTRRATATSNDVITTGSVGIPVRLDLSDEFEGLAVTTCFRAGGRSAYVPYTGDPLTVPVKCLQIPGETLEVGVYAARADGTIVIPTAWAIAGTVRQGVEPSGIAPEEPEPSWAAKVLEMATEALETAREVAADYRYRLVVREGRLVILDTGKE